MRRLNNSEMLNKLKELKAKRPSQHLRRRRDILLAPTEQSEQSEFCRVKGLKVLIELPEGLLGPKRWRGLSGVEFGRAGVSMPPIEIPHSKVVMMLFGMRFVAFVFC